MRHRPPSGNSPLPANASPSSSADLHRRRFLLTLGAGGATAATAAVAALPGSAVVATDVTAETANTGYRETDHVQDYYRTART
jgi:hypothetical protein